ncbi:MAG: XdhC family protein [Blastocatellia bacterium]
MAEPKTLLEDIESRSMRGEPVAVVRALEIGSGGRATVSVSRGEIFPPIKDRQLAAHILAAVNTLTDKGGIADLVEVEDEQGSRVTLAVEVVKPKLALVIFGAGHVGQAVAILGALTGYDVTVIDDREEFASRKRFPDGRIELLSGDYATAIGELAITPSTAVVIVTRGHQYDELCLKNLINSSANYIGMIGSRRRVLSVFKKLASEGLSDERLKRVHAPIGLRIGAKSPQEIAISILAEIIGHVNNPHLEDKGERNAI